MRSEGLGEKKGRNRTALVFVEMTRRGGRTVWNGCKLGIGTLGLLILKLPLLLFIYIYYGSVYCMHINLTLLTPY